MEKSGAINYNAEKIIFSWIGFGCLILSVISYHVCFNLASTLPANINWLMSARHDWGQHYLGWAFFREEPWTFPLGTIHNYYFPIGSNVGFTDSIPLLAIFFKLFNAILPEDFQYIGMWLFACILLTSIYSLLLLKIFDVKDRYVLLIIAFVAINPVLIYRGIHPALCAHWIFLAGLYSYFNTKKSENIRSSLVHQFVIVSLSAAINPYLCFMAMGFTFVIPLKVWLEKKISTSFFILYNVISIASILIIWIVIGLITFGKDEDLAVSNAFGLYSLNLNSLINASGYSVFLPQFPQVSWHQYEGFMYLGMGIMVCMVLSTIYFIGRISINRTLLYDWFKRNSITIVPLGIFVFLLTLFSITHMVSWNDKVIFEIHIPMFIKSLGDTFRASARFFWIPYYMLFGGCLILLAKAHLKEWIKLSILAIALLIQVYDIKPLLLSRTFMPGPYTPPMNESSWRSLIREFDTVVMYPPFQGSYQKSMDYQDFCYLSLKEEKPITTGYVARIDNKAVAAFNDTLNNSFDIANIDPRSLIVTDEKNLQRFSMLIQNGVVKLNTLDGYYFMYASSRSDSSLNNLALRINLLGKEKRVDYLDRFGAPPKLRKIPSIPRENIGEINFAVDRYKESKEFILLIGWAFQPIHSVKDSIFIYFTSRENSYLLPVMKFPRPDVADYFKIPNLEAGFSALPNKNQFENGKFKIGIAIKDSLQKLKFTLTDRIVSIGSGDTSPYVRIEQPPSIEMTQNVDQFADNETYVRVGGWVVLKNQDSNQLQISLILKNGSDFYLIPTENVLRPDVTSHFHNKYNLDYSGFFVEIEKAALPKNEYQVGIYVKDPKTKKEGMQLLDRTVKF